MLNWQLNATLLAGKPQPTPQELFLKTTTTTRTRREEKEEEKNILFEVIFLSVSIKFSKFYNKKKHRSARKCKLAV